MSGRETRTLQVSTWHTIERALETCLAATMTGPKTDTIRYAAALSDLSASLSQEEQRQAHESESRAQ